MAEQDDQDQGLKSQEPTEKKIMDARKKGDVPMSRETGTMMLMVSMLGVILLALPWQIPNLVAALAGLIDNAGRIPLGDGTAALVMLGQIFREFFMSIVIALAPIFGVLILGALVGVILGGDIVVAPERLKPELSKISLRSGFKRQFSWNALVEFAKSLIKVLVVGTLALWVTDRAVRAMWQTPGFLPEHLPGYMVDSAQILLVAAAVFMIPVAIADIMWRRFEWKRKLMMTHKEVRDELKEMQGSPEIRAKRFQLRRQYSRQRIQAAVPTADVVLTNPTHFAVALKYEMGADLAPICVAKGSDNMAHTIRSLAHEHEIPVIENKPLARMLFDVVDVDATVPVEHWEVVAEIISYVMDLRDNPGRLPPSGSTLRTD